MGTPKPIDWVETTLGEVIENYDYKRIPLNSRDRARRQGIYPYYGASGIIDHIDDYIFDGRYLLIAEDGENLNSRKTPVAFFANGKFWVNNHAHIVRGIDGVSDDYFLMSYIQNMNISGYITGAAQPKLSQANLNSIKVTLPPLPTQRRIAQILSAYDDLIENNTRRIRILEQMAQATYQEWFGKVDKESMPKGWIMTTLGEACNIVMGQSPASEFYNEEGKGLPFHQGVTNFGDRFPTDKIFCTAENRIAEKGDVLFSVRAPVGRLNISTKKIIIGRGLCAIRSKTGKPSFVFQQLKEQFHEDDMMGGGTIFKSVTKDDVHGIKFLLPSSDIIEKFETFANPISQELEILTAKNANLRQTRDLLLPRLVSGEVEV